MAVDTAKENLYLKIITTEGIKFSDYVRIATIETKVDGFEGFMRKHLPMVAEVTLGQCAITDLSGKKRIAVLAGGFLYNDGEQLKILTPYFEFNDKVIRQDVVNKIDALEKEIKTEKNPNKLNTLKVTLKNEKDKLTAIDNFYIKNQKALA